MQIKLFQNMSIKNKLVLIIISTSAFAIILGLLVYSIFDIINYKKEMENNASLNATLVGEYCSAALMFGYKEEANNILKELEALPGIINACVYDKENKVFAFYNKSPVDQISFPSPSNQQTEFSRDYFHVFKPIIQQNEKIGIIYLRISTAPLTEKIISNIVICFILLITLGGPVFILASRLQRLISEPILKLADVTTKVSQNKDYSIRVETNRKDAIGVLYNRFNEMFEQIENNVDSLLKLSRAVEQSPVSIIITDTNGDIEYVNPKAAEITGYQFAELVGKNPRIFSSGEKPKSEYKVLWDTISSGKEWWGELHNKKKNGELFWESTLISPIINEKGVTAYYIAVKEDITERKRAEESLEENEKRYKELFDNAPVGYHELDINGRITRINRTELNMLGYTEEEMIGQFIWKFVEDKEIFQQHVFEKLKGIRPPAKGDERIYRRKDLTTFPILVEEIILRDAMDNIRGIRTTIQDITNRKQAEDKLRESEALLNDAMRIAKLGVWEYDVGLDQFKFNDQFYTLFNTTAEREGGYTMSSAHYVQKFVHPDDLAIVGVEIQKSLETTDPDYYSIFDHRIICADGEIKYIIVHIRLKKDAQGRTVKNHGVNQDITERKLSEVALREREQLFRGLFNASPMAINLMDPHNPTILWPIIDCNEATCLMNGFTREELIGHTIDVLNARQGSREESDDYFKKLKKEGIIHVDVVHRHKDGHLFPVETSTTVVTLGGHEMVLGIDQDITERKRAEEVLTHERNLLRALMDNTPDHIYFKDLENRFIRISKAQADSFGISDSVQAIGKTDFDFFTEEHARPAYETELEIMKTGRPIVGLEEKETWPDGTETWVSTTKVPLRDVNGEIIGTFGISRDITERKRAEEEIIFEKNKFAQLFDNSPIAIALVDDQDKVVHINDSFTKLFGYFLEEIKGLSINEIIVPPELKEEALTFLDETQSGNQINKESYRKKKDGSNIFVQIIGVPIVINDKTIGIYDMYVNLTQRKDVEEKMKIAKELAEQSDKLKSEFLAQMSHEIRTPINVIVGNVDYLNQSFSKKMDSDARDCFDGINLASKRIIRTVDLILNAAELQTSGYKPQFVKVDLNSEILNKLYQEHQLSAKQKGLEIIYTCKEKDTKVIADEYSITQIFANLIDNAIKYTKKGKIEILLGKNKTGNIMVEVKDTGIGISKEFFPRLFELFTQEEQGYTRSFEGNGLGLALVKNYCDINNAIIEVESEKNVGSTFRVIFRS